MCFKEINFYLFITNFSFIKETTHLYQCTIHSYQFLHCSEILNQTATVEKIINKNAKSNQKSPFPEN